MDVKNHTFLDEDRVKGVKTSRYHSETSPWWLTWRQILFILHVFWIVVCKYANEALYNEKFANFHTFSEHKCEHWVKPVSKFLLLTY